MFWFSERYSFVLYTLVVLFSLVYANSKGPVVVLITGCSTGIGASIAIDMGKQERFKVYATMRSVEKAPTELKNLENVSIIPLDVTSEESIAIAVREVIEKEGKIDIVVNNAGYGLAGTLEMVSIEEAKKLFDVNVWGVVRVLHAVLPHMRKAKSGHIINISSTSGIRGIAGMEFYTGSKFAIEGISDSMRYSLAEFNIAVTNVNAGPAKTAFTDRFGVTEMGGMGTRDPQDPTGYLRHVTNTAVESLSKRMSSFEAQKADDVAMIVVNVAKIGLDRAHIEDVPFNIGTSPQSMAILQHIRAFSTGWGGMYSGLLARMPKLSDVPKEWESHEEL